MANSVEYIYEIYDRYSAKAAAIARSTKKMSSAMDVQRRKLAGVSKSMEKYGQRMSSLQGIVGTAALTAGLVAAAKRSSDVEDGLQDLVRVGNLTDKQILKMSNSMELFSEKIGVDKVGLLRQGFQGLKMGIPIKELRTFINLGARTAVAFDMSDDAAGRSLGSIRAKLKMTTGELDNLMDKVNYVADNFAADGARMVNIVERTSGSMGTLGFSEAQVAGFAGFADQIEVTQQLAASGLNQMFAKMQKSPRIVKQMLQDPVKATVDVLSRFKKLAPEKMGAAIRKTFGDEAGRFVEKFVNNIDLFEKTYQSAASKMASGSMQRELDNQLSRTSRLYLILKQKFKNTLESIGDQIRPMTRYVLGVMTKVADKIKLFTKNYPNLVRFGVILAGIAVVFGTLALTAGVAMMALSPLVGLIGGSIAPVAASIALFTAFVVVIKRWIETNNPLIERVVRIGTKLGVLGGKVGDIIKKVLVLLGVFEKGEGSAGIFGMAIDYIGVMLDQILMPVEALIDGLNKVFDLIEKIANSDLSKVGGSLKAGVMEGGAGIGKMLSLYNKGEFSQAGQAAMGTLGSVEDSIANALYHLLGSSEDKGKQMLNQVSGSGVSAVAPKVEVGGTIRVEAAGGARVTSADISLNQGSNMAYAQ